VSPAAIELRGLRKVYRRGKKETLAVDGLDLTIPRGEVFGLLGPNGAGKTTTVEICEGLLPPTAGEVTVLGMSWNDQRGQGIRERIGVCLQETKFFEKQTVRETLDLFRSFYRRGRTVDEVLDVVELREKADARQMQMSGGQRQRLAVAAALLGDPELLFLDEPTTGLDPQSRRKLWDVVRDFQARSGSVLLTTHYMDEAAVLCDRVGVVDHGKLIALGTPAELVRSLGGEHLVEVEFDAGAQLDERELQSLPTVQRCRLVAEQASLYVGSVHEAVPPLLAVLDARGIALRGLATRHATLEDVFVNLTGRHLREEGS
jgi:ABC-2 type transport system ATP-binding protein